MSEATGVGLFCGGLGLLFGYALGVIDQWGKECINCVYRRAADFQERS